MVAQARNTSYGAKMGDPAWKIIEAKRVVYMAQVVDCLPSKHKNMSSDSSTEKKKNLHYITIIFLEAHAHML
jgi:hypothetical protein